MRVFLGLLFTGFVLLLSVALTWWRARDRKRGIILMLLLDHPDSHVKQLQTLSKGRLGIGIHPTLRLLEDEGLLSAREDRYTLTERGTNEARRLRDESALE